MLRNNPLPLPRLDEGLPTKNEQPYLGLQKRRQFLRVQGTGTRFRRRHLVLLVLANDVETSRVGFTVSKRVGNAVVRNRVRRRLREGVRGNSPILCAGMDYVIIALPQSARVEFKVLCSELSSLLQEVEAWASRRVS